MTECYNPKLKKIKSELVSKVCKLTDFYKLLEEKDSSEEFNKMVENRCWEIIKEISNTVSE